MPNNNLGLGTTIGSSIVASTITPQQRTIINVASRALSAGLLAREVIIREQNRADSLRREQSDGIDVQAQAFSSTSNNFYKTDFSYTNVRGIFALKIDNEQYIQFQFNPEEITDEKSVEYTDRQKTGRDEADYIWIKGGPRTLTFKLTLDATISSKVKHLGKSNARDFDYSTDSFTHDPDRGVLNQVEFLQSLQRPFVKDHGLSPNKTLKPRFVRGGAIQGSEPFANPPEVIFVYGNFYLEGVVASLSTTYNLWDKNLIPLRAECNITFRVKEGGAISINSNLTNF